jgi:uncharacterized protein
MPRSSPSTEQAQRFVAGLVIVVALGIAAALALPLSGQKTGAVLVDDAAGLMDEEQRARVAEYHGFLLEDHEIDYRVVTLEDSGDISLFAVERFEELDVGQSSQTGRGLMLVIDAGRDEVRLEVGYALEGAFPDAFVAYIEERQMVPFFGARRVADGILAASELIIARAQRAKQHAGLESEPAMTGSGGGGATAGAGLGVGLGAGPSEAPSRPTQSGFEAGATPRETLARYFDAMDRRNGDPSLPLYTPQTRRMLEGWVMTPAQMDNLVATYRTCQGEPTLRDEARGLAVIRYPPAARACAPFFFESSPDGWQLDLTMMQRALRFGRSNAWRFDLSVAHPYGFAFEDWRFDDKGFPRP